MADTLQQQMLMAQIPEIGDSSRQRKLAEMLLAKGFQQPQGQMVSGRYVAPSWAEQLLPMANILAGQSLGERADEDRKSGLAKLLMQQQMEQKGLTEALSSTPAIGTEMAGPYGQDVNKSGLDVPMPVSVQAGKGPDYAKAMGIINGSRFGTGKELQGPLFERMSPKPTSEMQNFEYNLQDPRFGEYLIRKAKATAPNMTAITNVKAFEPFANKTQAEMGSSLVKNFDTLQGIPGQIKTLSQVAELAPKSFAGSLAKQKLDAAKFLNNNLGLNVASDKMVNTEVLNTVLFTNIMDNLKKMDAQPSQMQQMEMKAGLGNIGTDPKALPKVIKVYTDVLEGKAREHNRRVNEASTKMQFPYSIIVPLDESGGGGTVDFNKLQPKR